jgi:uncharacterized membrane protein
MRTNIGIWVGFVLVSLVSLVVYKTAWSVSFYWLLLSCLAVIAVVMGLVALRQTGVRPWSLVAVVGGLVVGQWWLIQWLLVVAFGKWRGFAP